MTDTPGDLPTADEADAIEQAQAADGGIDEPDDDHENDLANEADPARWDADEADVLEEAQTVKPAREDEYPSPDEI
jgi:hypothetical protein